MLLQSSRQEVLSGLGLRSWYCRFTLPNAAETPATIYSDNSSEKNILVESVSQDSAALASNILEVVEVENKSRSVDSAQPKLSTILVDEGESLVDSPELAKESSAERPIVSELCLTMTVFDKVVVLYERSVSSDDVQEKNLLDNILSVMSQTKAHSCGRESVFSWPIFESAAFISEQSRHFDLVVRRWLQEQCWSECSHVLYFGNSYSVVEPVMTRIKAEQSFEYTLVSFPDSLFHLLSSPIKKKNLWGLISRTGVFCG